jgi:hypothetical protein
MLLGLAALWLMPLFTARLRGVDSDVNDRSRLPMENRR